MASIGKCFDNKDMGKIYLEILVYIFCNECFIQYNCEKKCKNIKYQFENYVYVT